MGLSQTLDCQVEHQDLKLQKINHISHIKHQNYISHHGFFSPYFDKPSYLVASTFAQVALPREGTEFGETG